MSSLAGKRILVVEDEAVVAAMVEDMLIDLGAVVVGPVMTINQGLALAGTETIDAAVLDVNVRGERIDPVADVLRERAIPIVFATGYGESGAGTAHNEPVLEKPYRLEGLRSALAHALMTR